MKIFRSALFILLVLGNQSVFSQQISPSFKIVPLGVRGGSDESNLSCYMLAPAQSKNFVCLDAGTVYSGLKESVKKGVFKKEPDYVLKNYIKGYLISHPHLDHIAGLIMNSPDDTSKYIYGSPFTLDIVKDKYFSWKSWANFGNEGEKPQLNKYQYSVLNSGSEMPIANTEMYVKAFTLSHVNPYESTAFLVRADSSYILYLGDTGADEVEKADNLHKIWVEIAPLIISKKLKGIFLEVSFSNKQPVKQLFGHLTPQLLMQEMQSLAKITDSKALTDFKVFITHIKPAVSSESEIKKQLSELNTLKLNFVFPQQAKEIKL